MGIRIQPLEIEVPEEDPFKNDLLERRQPAEILTHLIGSIEGPCVIAVDAAWGTGKTTFLKLWAQFLRTQRFVVVEFNAWETDFSGDPFVALATELTENLDRSANPALKAKTESTRKLAKEVSRRIVPGAIRVVTSGIIDIQAVIDKADRMSDYREARKCIGEFRKSLQEMAASVAESKDHRPLVVIIDELDRCRPLYAVELLEAAKHLFAEDGIVFVLALNRSELAHSIRSVYGVGFDATGYLRRFFDVDFRLPDPDRVELISRALDTVRISEYFERTTDREAKRGQDAKVMRDWLTSFLGSSDFSLRRVTKAIHHLGLVFASLSSDERPYAIAAAVALILRTANPELYYKFARGEATDFDVVERVFNDNPGLRDLRHEHAGRMFELVIVQAAFEISGANGAPSDSPLARFYMKQIDAESTETADKQHAEGVISDIRAYADRGFSYFGGIAGRFGFKHWVDRLELVAPGLIGDESASHEPKSNLQPES